MLSKRIIACLDVRDGKLAKSVKFVDTKDIGDPVLKAREYYEDGLDELVFYDITASSDARNIMLGVVEQVAKQVYIPFSVGGGVRTVEDANKLLWAGAEKNQCELCCGQAPRIDCRVCACVWCSKHSALDGYFKGRNFEGVPEWLRSHYQWRTHPHGCRCAGMGAQG